MGKKIGRREFIKKSAQYGLTAAVGGSTLSHLVHAPSAFAMAHEGHGIAVVEGVDYFASTFKAVELLGGMDHFVPKGSRVAILPNVQRWHPGTFTKPEIVRAIVQMCKKAGAKEVNCLSWLGMDNWEKAGLASVLKEEGANLKLVESEEANFKPVKVPMGKALKEAMIMKEFFNNDVFIDIPITKDHAGNKFTGTMKNMMGLNYPTNNRENFHRPGWKTDINDIKHLDQCIADLNTIFLPALCVVDATEFIITNGPMGPGEITKPQQVVAGVDRVAMDAYCCTLWGLEAEDLFQIKMAQDHGLGHMDLKKTKIKKVKI
ncbi:MAG: DUF362 domain-containing protein [Candidatus Aminicenantes bacterium]|nr:DUF362 domain-containing protein [Candidatus Aminicenantes bacterium]